MATYKNPTTGVTIDTALHPNKTPQDLANQGFNPIESPVDTPNTVVETPVIETPVVNEPVVDEVVVETPVVEEPQVFNKEEITTKINETLQVEGVGQKQANSQFIDAITRVKLGRNATDEEKAGGLTVSQVLKNFDAMDLAPNMGVGIDDKEEVVVEEAPKSTTEKMQDLLKNFSSGKKEAITDKQEEVGLMAKSTAIGEAQTLVNDLRTEIANKKILNFKELEALEDGSPFLVSTVKRQQRDLTQDQKLDLMITQNDYNNALVAQSIAQGNYDRAQELVQQTADIFKENFDNQLAVLKAQGVIDDNEADRLAKEAEYERELALNGYVYISNPEELAKFTKDEIFRDPVSGRIYKKPVVEEIDNLKELVTNMITKYPDAGISMDDTLAQAQAKLNSSKIYKQQTRLSGGTGGDDVKSFIFSSNDIGRLIAVDFSNTDVQQIQSDINEFGVEKVVEGMDEKQANAIRNIAGGVTPTQEKKENEPKSVTAAKRKIIGNINALISDNASNEEIEEYISLTGYKKEDFSEQLNGYTPTVEESKWSKFWGFLTGN